MIEQPNGGGWQGRSTRDAPEWKLWNGNCVGGATNFTSGFFYRLKPEDFRQRSEYGPIEGAHVVDWPLDYSDFEPWYALVEREVGLSGRVEPHPRQQPRSTPDFPYPPTAEHPLAGRIDATCRALGLHPLRIPRAILPHAVGARRGCEYSGYCGSHGCASGAKGSSRAALLARAVATGRCAIPPARAGAPARQRCAGSRARGRIQRGRRQRAARHGQDSSSSPATRSRVHACCYSRAGRAIPGASATAAARSGATCSSRRAAPAARPSHTSVSPRSCPDSPGSAPS